MMKAIPASFRDEVEDLNVELMSAVCVFGIVSDTIADDEQDGDALYGCFSHFRDISKKLQQLVENAEILHIPD